jgi:hypothetical protein
MKECSWVMNGHMLFTREGPSTAVNDFKKTEDQKCLFSCVFATEAAVFADRIDLAMQVLLT